MTHPYDVQRLRGRKGMARRARVLRRDNGLCQPCKANGRLTLAKQADHIIALANNGEDTEDNMQAICPECHRMKTAIDLGLTIKHGCDGNGLPSDPNHGWNK